jgi:hypothetical protein
MLPPKNKVEAERMSWRRSLIMSINYATVMFRPDIAFGSTAISRFAINPNEHIEIIALQMLKYLDKTKQLGIAYSPGDDTITGGESERPEGWFDASWVNHDPVTKAKSVSGKLFRAFNGPIQWSSKGQQAQSVSSAGAELQSLISGVSDGISLRDFAYEANITQKHAMRLYTDNKAAVFIAEDATSVKRAKAESRHAIFLQECVEEGIFEVKHWPGKANVADMLTKWLARNEFEKHRAILLNLKAHRALGIQVD